MTLLDAKEMLRREYDTLQKRGKKETAFKAYAQLNEPRRFQGNRGHRGQEEIRDRYHNSRRANANANFQGKCFECGRRGHKRSQCRNVKPSRPGDEFVFSRLSDKTIASSTWLLDSEASHHMTDDKRENVEYEDSITPICINVANEQQLKAQGTGTVCFVL